MIAAVVFIFFYLLLGFPILGVEWIVAKFNQKAADISQLRMVQWAFRCVLFLCGVKVEVNGHEKVPKDEAVLYVGNHRGIFDIIASYPQCENLTGYIAKASVRKVPGLNLWMKRLYCLFMVREDVKQSLKVILSAIDQINRGISICVFPEGTRNKDREHPDQLLPFKEGTFKIAQKTGCKIVPMGIIGSDEIFENHKPWVKKGKITIVYGDPIDLKDLDKETEKRLGSYCQKIVTDLVKEAMYK